MSEFGTKGIPLGRKLNRWGGGEFTHPYQVLLEPSGNRHIIQHVLSAYYVLDTQGTELEGPTFHPWEKPLVKAVRGRGQGTSPPTPPNAGAGEHRSSPSSYNHKISPYSFGDLESAPFLAASVLGRPDVVPAAGASTSLGGSTTLNAERTDPLAQRMTLSCLPRLWVANWPC